MRKLILAVMLSVLLLGFGTSYAATAALDNLPAGAHVGYWQVSDGGWWSIMNIQNVAGSSDIGCNAAILVHVTFYDKASIEIANFLVPLSSLDNFGAQIFLTGTLLTVQPTGCPNPLPGAAGASGGCDPIYATVTPDPDGIAAGYFTTAISSIDCGRDFLGIYYLPADVRRLTSFAAGNNDGDPWNDTDMSCNLGVGVDSVAPNWTIVRTAHVNLATGLGFAMNAKGIQQFHNKCRVQEAAGLDFANTIPAADVPCGFIDWNNDGWLVPQIWNSTERGLGINIDQWELYASLELDTSAIGTNVTNRIITDNCLRNGRRAIFGSGDTWYWARYFETPGLSASTLVTIAPALNLPGGVNPLVIDGAAFDDNERFVSIHTNPYEASRCDFTADSTEFTIGCAPAPGSGINHSLNQNGEISVTINNPVFGFVYTVVANATGNYADIQPLTPRELLIVPTNLQPLTSAGAGAPFPLPILDLTAAGNMAIPLQVVLPYGGSSGVVAIGAFPLH